MKTDRPPRDVLADPRNVRDGNNPEIDAAVEAKVQALLEKRLTAAVQEATAPLQNTIDRLAQNRDSILREKREIERAAVKDAEDREAARPKSVPITREQARDPQVYRRVKEEAAKRGVPVRFVEVTERRGEPREVFASATHYHVYGPRIKGDNAAYWQHKVEAQRRGLRFHCAYTAAEMPKEAFEDGGEQ